MTNIINAVIYVQSFYHWKTYIIEKYIHDCEGIFFWGNKNKDKE